MINELPSIAEAGAGLRNGQWSPLDLVEFCLSRIAASESQVHAWVLVDEVGARAAARSLGDLLRQGTDCGPLHGIPVAIKDIVDVAGWPTRAGSTLRAGHRALRDATVVRQLRRAGAILLGKTVTTEFACFDPPPTRNPWNLAHTPGGSSSGSAAAVALNMCSLAIGSQTGGSITRPAAYCGVSGLKPTIGAVSTEGVVPISPYLDHVGPLAQRVSDLQAAWEVLGQARVDSTASPTSLDAPRWQPRLRRLGEYFLEQADPEVASNFQAVAEQLTDRRAHPPLTLPGSFVEVHARHRCLMSTGAAETHQTLFEQHRDGFSRHVRGLIDEGRDQSAVEFARALKHQAVFRQEMQDLLDNYWIAMTPATPTAAPASLQTTGDPRFNSPWSYSGLPTLTIPCGLTRQGMPLGLQLIASLHQETELLAAAAWCESQFGFTARPSPAQHSSGTHE